MTKILYGAGRDTREITNFKFVWVVVVVFAQSFSCQTKCRLDHDSFVLKVLTAHTLPMHLYLTGSQLTYQGLEP